MNRSQIFFFLAILTIFSTLPGCQFEKPSETPTIRVEMVFRSPRDINLQPEDVPDLQEVPVENPAQEPLIPEVIDQDQRAYVNVDQDINIESNVIMVPEQTSRTNDELYNLVVIPRRTSIQRQGKDETCDLGERCRLLPIVDSVCGPGWVATTVRNNIIIVIFACGRGVDKERIIRLGKYIDDRIKAPPSHEEIALATQAMLTTQTEAANATLTAIGITLTPLTPAGLTPTEDACLNLNLTPEECANSGSHLYSWVTKRDTNSCVWPPDGCPESGCPGESIITFNFGQRSVTYYSGNELIANCDKTNPNTYYCEWVYGETNHKVTMVFKTTGYEEEWKTTTSGVGGCEGVFQATIVEN